MKHLARIVEFILKPHTNADTLSLAMIQGTGWQCVVRTQDWVGSPYQLRVEYPDGLDRYEGIYIALDALLDVSRPEFAFLVKQATKTFPDGRPGHRMKTVKLRGKISQGLVIPIPDSVRHMLLTVPADAMKIRAAVPGKADLDAVAHLMKGPTTEQDLENLYICEALGIERYEPPVPTDLNQEAVRSPGSFVRYTEIENAKNHPTWFKEGEQVRVTEKIHGCLEGHTRIALADGNVVPISELVCANAVSTEVLGMDETGKVVPTRITRVYNNGPTGEWLKIRGTRRGAGRGNHFFALTCTPNHRFWVVEGRAQYKYDSEVQKMTLAARSYIQARDLVPGDKVLLLRSEKGLTPIQEQVLLGKMLGDAYLHDTGGTAGIQFSHKEEHRAYIEWTYRGLGDLASGTIEPATSGYGSDMLMARSICSNYTREYLGDFYSTDGKRVPEWVAAEMGPIAIAFWYMDDGSLGHDKDRSEDKANFAVCAFNENNCRVIIQGLAKFGITAVYYTSEGYPRLRLNADDAERLFLLIAPYIPPVMQYKLPERYRGHPGWLPSMDSQYKSMLVEQEILDVAPFHPDRTTRYDLETETHNYFANGVLVHNSNFRVGMAVGDTDDPEYIVGSYDTARKPDGTTPYAQVAQRHFSEKRMREVTVMFPRFTEHFQIIAEIFGPGIQDLHYGCKPGTYGIKVIEVVKDHVYQPWEVILEVAAMFNIPTVPLLYRGPYNAEKIASLRDGKTTVAGATHVREGCVVTAEPETRIVDDDGDSYRKVLKFVSDEYLCRAGEKDGH